MKHNRIISIALIGSFVLLAASCEKEVTSNEDLYRPAGTPIVFSAATSYQNAPETRAEYSGDLTSTTPVYERIYWEDGDKIQIVHNGTAPSSYIIATGTNNQGERESYATLKNVSNPLVWDGSGNHTFYGLYPSGNGASGTLSTTGDVTGTIPRQQDILYVSSQPKTITVNGVTKYQPNTDDYGYMVAKASITANSNANEVRLPFRPAFTTFEFKLQRASGQPDVAISSFEVKTVPVNGTTTPLNGQFSLTINGGTDINDGIAWTTPQVTPVSGVDANSIIVSGFPGGEVHIPDANNGGYLDFSVLAVPTDLTGVELIIHYKNGSSKTLKFKNHTNPSDPSSPLEWHTFTGAKKYIITNTQVPGSFNWIYRIEEISDITTYGHLAVSSDVGIVSYRYLEENGSPIPGSYEAVAWKAQYSNGSTWNDWTAAQGDFSFGSSYTGNGVSDITTNEPRTVSLVDNTNYSSTGHHSSTYILQHRTPVTGKYVLCNHDLYGNTINSSTANTYVVTTSGTYTFPCVYGNGIDNGSSNAAAYNKSCFHNAANVQISNEWIRTDMMAYGLNIDTDVCAEVVWQDEEIITTTPTARLDGGNYWIDFTINQNDIKPGNAVIALKATVKDGNGNVFGGLSNVILWSWQIWVTDQNLTPIDYMLPVNLGWNVDGEVQTIQYTNRELPIRIQQIAPSDDPTGAVAHADFTFTQLADAAQTYELAIGSNPYYQWGRKDPMIPGLYSPVANERGDYNVDKPIYPGANYSSMNSETQDPGSTKTYAEYGPGIRKPYVGLRNEWTTGWIGGDHTVIGDAVAAPYNLWDNYITSANATGSNDSGVHKIKTVYDPCPVGFTVPCYSRFNDYVSNYTETDGGMNFSSGLFLPYSGARIFYNRVAWGEYDALNPGPAIPAALYLRHVNQIGLYWTDTPYQDVRFATILLFSEGSSIRTNYTRGTAAAIRPMVDPKHPLTVPSNYPPSEP